MQEVPLSNNASEAITGPSGISASDGTAGGTSHPLPHPSTGTLWYPTAFRSILGSI